MSMRFTVASHHIHPDAYWLAQPHAYTTMTRPPEWAVIHQRNLDLLTPPADIVWAIKAGRISDAQYTQGYWDALRPRWGQIQRWVKSHADDHVILLCACAAGQHCHRWLIRELLLKMGCEEVPLPCEESEPMEDVVVTVPLSFGLDTWIEEGDPAGAPWSGEEWHFYLGSLKPNIKPGGRVYIVYNGILRGYAPLVRVDVDYGSGGDPIRLGYSGPPRYALVRHGGAVAVTVDEHIPGFRGFRARWWKREDERPFDYPWYDGRPAWQVSMEWERRALTDRAGVAPAKATHLMGLALDRTPIAAYYKHAGVWCCTKCDETFPTAGSVQEHIKASDDHIQRGVQGYLARKAEREAVSA